VLHAVGIAGPGALDRGGWTVGTSSLHAPTRLSLVSAIERNDETAAYACLVSGDLQRATDGEREYRSCQATCAGESAGHCEGSPNTVSSLILATRPTAFSLGV
jgi:hypothetical protein